MDRENYFQNRKIASDWLNSKKQDFYEGLEILQKAGYKPHVVALIAKWGGDKPLSKQKLLHEMYSFISFVYNPEHPKHEDIIEDDLVVSKEYDISDYQKDEQEEQYPAIIRAAVHEFYDMYQQRSILHRTMAEVGEKNDDASVKARKNSLTLMKALSEKMDRLWAIIDAYKKNGTMPETLDAPEPKAPDKEPAKDELPEDIEKLKKLKIAISHKITKRKNFLLFQQETKAEKPNPLPDGAKREKYKKEIKHLTESREVINMKIVNLS